MAVVRCPKCKQPVPPQQFNQEQLVRCKRCGYGLRVAAYPALLQVTIGQAGRARQGEEESSCFFHPAKVAAFACDSCGRFLCSLCEVTLGPKHLCPTCYEQRCLGQTGANNEYTHLDNVALLLSVIPTLLTGLIAIFLVVRNWNRPMSALPRTRVRHVIALLLALIQVGYLGYAWTR